MFIHDASSGTMPEELGTEWCREWLAEALPEMNRTAAKEAA